MLFNGRDFVKRSRGLACAAGAEPARRLLNAMIEGSIVAV